MDLKLGLLISKALSIFPYTLWDLAHNPFFYSHNPKLHILT